MNYQGETKEVKFEKGECKYRVVVAESTLRTGVVRSALVEEQKEKVAKMKVGKNAFSEGAEIAIRIWTYPSLIAATVENEGFDKWPLSADDVLELPEGFSREWENAVYKLNPHWTPVFEGVDIEAEKKVRKSGGK